MKIKKTFALLMMTISLSGCSYLYDKFVYQIDVTQGNYIDDEKLNDIKIGMTQEQIIFLLGSPMLIDQFDSSKWYYIRYIKPGGKPAQQANIILTFKDKILIDIVSKNTDLSNPLIKNPKANNEPNEATQKDQTTLPATSE